MSYFSGIYGDRLLLMGQVLQNLNKAKYFFNYLLTDYLKELFSRLPLGSLRFMELMWLYKTVVCSCALAVRFLCVSLLQRYGKVFRICKSFF